MRPCKAALALAALLLAGCAAPPSELAAIDRDINGHMQWRAEALPAGWRGLDCRAGNCTHFAVAKYLELCRRGLPARIVVYWHRERREWHAVVRSGAWVLDSLPPSPRPWRPIPGGWIEHDVTFAWHYTATQAHSGPEGR